MSGEPGEELSEVLPAGRKQRVDSTSEHPLQVIASQPSVVLHVTDGRFDAVALAIPATQMRLLLAFDFGDEHARRTGVVVAAVAFVHVDFTANRLSHHLLDLLDGSGQRVAVKRP